jgi:hypothetical protein
MHQGVRLFPRAYRKSHKPATQNGGTALSSLDSLKKHRKRAPIENPHLRRSREKLALSLLRGRELTMSDLLSRQWQSQGRSVASPLRWVHGFAARPLPAGPPQPRRREAARSLSVSAGPEGSRPQGRNDAPEVILRRALLCFRQSAPRAALPNNGRQPDPRFGDITVKVSCGRLALGR